MAGLAPLRIGLVLRRSIPETLEASVAAKAMPPFASYARMAVVALLMLLSVTITACVLNFMTTCVRTTLAMSSGVAFGATIVIGAAGIEGIKFEEFPRSPLIRVDVSGGLCHG